MPSTPQTQADSRPLSEDQWQLLMADPAKASELTVYDGPNRRQEPRTEHREVMHLFFTLTPGHTTNDDELVTKKAEKRYLVRARDLSPSGLRFVHTEALPVDASCRVALLTRGQKLVHREATVCAVTEKGVRHFEIGVRLDKPVKVGQF